MGLIPPNEPHFNNRGVADEQIVASYEILSTRITPPPSRTKFDAIK